MTPDETTRSVPVLPVGDVRAALMSYRELGFTARIDAGGTYGFLRMGGIRIHLTERVDGHLPGPSECYLYVEDADELAARWTELATVGAVSAPADTSWNMREAVYTDADGNRVRFGHHLRVA